MKKYMLFFLILLQTLSAYSLEQAIGRMFIHDNPPLIVDWSEKCGCTCVWKTLLDNYGLLKEALQHSSWIHDYRMQVYSKKHRVTIRRFLDSHYIKIKFVRSPYTRAVSSYLHSCKNTTYNGSFENFLTRLKTKNWGDLSPRHRGTVRSHSKKQSRPTDKYMNYIVHIENANLDEINAQIGLNLSLTKHSSHHHINYLDDCDTYVGDQPFTKMEQYPPFYCYYSPKTLKLVQEVYKEDVDTLGYTVPQKIIDFIAQTN